MRFIMIVGVAALATVTAGCATPPRTTAAPTTSSRTSSETVAANSGDMEKVVCKLEEATGSRLPRKRVCHTQREWAQMTTDSRQVTEKIQQQNGSRGPG